MTGEHLPKLDFKSRQFSCKSFQLCHAAIACEPTFAALHDKLQSLTGRH